MEGGASSRFFVQTGWLQFWSVLDSQDYNVLRDIFNWDRPKIDLVENVWGNYDLCCVSSDCLDDKKDTDIKKGCTIKVAKWRFYE